MMILATINQWVHDPKTIENSRCIFCVLAVLSLFFGGIFVSMKAENGAKWAVVTLKSLGIAVLAAVALMFLTILFVLTINVLGI